MDDADMDLLLALADEAEEGMAAKAAKGLQPYQKFGDATDPNIQKPTIADTHCKADAINPTQSRKSFTIDARPAAQPPAPRTQTGGRQVTDGYVDSVSGFRVSKPIIGSLVLRERLADDCVYLALKDISPSRDLSGRWATMAVLVSKAQATSRDGSSYCRWSLSDLAGKQVTLFLWRKAASELYKELEGSLLLLWSPQVRRDEGGGGGGGGAGFSLHIDKPEMLQRPGMAADFGFCRGTRKDGQRCTLPINKSNCEYCPYHAQAALRALSSNRSDMAGANLLQRQLLPQARAAQKQMAAATGRPLAGINSLIARPPPPKMAMAAAAVKHPHGGAGPGGSSCGSAAAAAAGASSGAYGSAADCEGTAAGGGGVGKRSYGAQLLANLQERQALDDGAPASKRRRSEADLRPFSVSESKARAIAAARAAGQLGAHSGRDLTAGNITSGGGRATAASAAAAKTPQQQGPPAVMTGMGATAVTTGRVSSAGSAPRLTAPPPLPAHIASLLKQPGSSGQPEAAAKMPPGVATSLGAVGPAGAGRERFAAGLTPPPAARACGSGSGKGKAADSGSMGSGAQPRDTPVEGQELRGVAATGGGGDADQDVVELEDMELELEVESEVEAEVAEGPGMAGNLGDGRSTEVSKTGSELKRLGRRAAEQGAESPGNCKMPDLNPGGRGAAAPAGMPASGSGREGLPPPEAGKAPYRQQPMQRRGDGSTGAAAAARRTVGSNGGAATQGHSTAAQEDMGSQAGAGAGAGGDGRAEERSGEPSGLDELLELFPELEEGVEDKDEEDAENRDEEGGESGRYDGAGAKDRTLHQAAGHGPTGRANGGCGASAGGQSTATAAIVGVDGGPRAAQQATGLLPRVAGLTAAPAAKAAEARKQQAAAAKAQAEKLKSIGLKGPTSGAPKPLGASNHTAVPTGAYGNNSTGLRPLQNNREVAAAAAALAAVKGLPLGRAAARSGVPAAAAPSGAAAAVGPRSAMAAAFGSLVSQLPEAASESRYTELSEEAAGEAVLSMLEGLEARDALVKQLDSVTHLKVTAWHCAQCDRLFEFLDKQCRADGHTMTKTTTLKRFWTCDHCNARITTLGVRFPSSRCSRCNNPSLEFTACTMYRGPKELKPVGMAAASGLACKENLFATLEQHPEMGRRTFR